MARITQPGLLTGLSGKIGNIVTYDLNGVQVVRSLPSRSKKRKVSKLQEMHLLAFKIQHRFAQHVKRSLIDRIWKRLPVKGGMNAYNLFIQTNRKAFNQEGIVAFPALLTLSIGDLDPAENFMVKKDVNELQFSWNKSYGGKRAGESDQLNLAVLLNRTELRIIENINVKREAGICRLPVPVNDEYKEGYVFWSSYNDADFSPSLYWNV